MRSLSSLLIAVGLTVSSSYSEEAGIVPALVPIRAAATVEIEGKEIHEASGLAQSGRHPGIAWVVNDGSGGSTLHALDADGKIRGKVSVAGIRTRDAEDLAAFTWRGVPHLLIADVGDNKSRADSYQLHAVPEPELGMKSVRPTWSIRYRYEDGAHNCESVAVDSKRGEILFLSKGKRSGLYALPLEPAGRILVAKKQADIASLDLPAGLTISAALRRIATHGVATGLDLSPDGRTAAVLTYSHINLYSRTETESWAEAFAKPPRMLPMPELRQAEAIAFVEDGDALWIASEKLPAMLARVPIP